MAIASPALVGTRPQRTRELAYSRDSNTLRASVLDVALELGVGTSRALENLIFDSVLEEDETPVSTSVSAATSDESWPSVPAWTGIHTQFVLPAPKPANVPTSSFEVQAVRSPSEDSHVPIIPPPHQPRKLRKARKDGYESDGGYLSDSVKKKKDKKDQKKSASSSHNSEDQPDGGYLSDTTKRGLDKKKKQKDKKGDKITDDRSSDSSVKTSHRSTKKSRTPSDDGDLSDGAYLSEAPTKKKKPFFRLRSRSPSAPRKGGAPGDTPPPPVPALPPASLPVAGGFARSPIPFDFPYGSLLNGGIPTQATHFPVPSSADEPPVLTSPPPSKGRSSRPPSNSSRHTTRSWSIDTSVENLTSSTTSHEHGWHSPVLPLVQTQEAAPYDPQHPRSHELEGYVLSAFHPGEQAPVSAPAAPRQYGVRFAPSRPFGSSDITLSLPSTPPVVAITPEKQPRRPKTSPQIASLSHKFSSSSVLPSPVVHAPSPMPPPSDPRPFLSRTPRTTPSPLMLTPSTSPPQHRASPALSESSIVSSSDFIVPSPRPRFFEDLPPPSPPPTCPLPELPSQDFPSQLIPTIGRGRQLPFPARGILPVHEASRLIERTERTRQEVLQVRHAAGQAEVPSVTIGDVINADVYGDENNDLTRPVETVAPMPPSPTLEQTHEEERDWPDDESVRPDVAQFYLYASPSPKEATAHRSPDVPDDERSTYTYSFARSSPSPPPPDMRASTTIPSARSDVLSYYFEELDRDRVGGDRERSSLVDRERSRELRARLLARVDALYSGDRIPPMPKLRQPF
ncbi:hypothetical protein BJV78DRAFT_1244607 [Lactifluus subvellereus]|nr:hypothetical protein BJV78DRAFT_1244607 [Lactifluus subvellereus]